VNLSLNKLNPDKAKPFVRRERKAAGLLKKMAELPKDEPAVSSAFIFVSNHSEFIIFSLRLSIQRKL
jgi:hypothetical protein